MSFDLSSTAFAAGATIPRQHTCDGPDLSPPLAWAGQPDGTQSLALIVDDPDAPAGTWVHWVLFNLPSATRQLPQDVPRVQNLPDGSKQGKNDFERIGYGGPCPPPGPAHRYFFRLYALDAMLDLAPGSTRAELDQAMAGHIVAETTVIGTYGRSQ